MKTPKIFKAALLVAAVAMVPFAGANAHGQGGGMMGPGYGMGPGTMGPGMIGPGYGTGPGMMGQGYGMGPGMMGPGMMNMMPMMHGMMMGPGMMGRGYGMGPGMMGAWSGRDVTEDDVRGFLGRHLEMHGLERLKVGKIDASDERVFKADIITKEDSLVVRVVVDRRTGFPVAFE